MHTALPTWPCQMEGCWRRAGDGGKCSLFWPPFPLDSACHTHISCSTDGRALCTTTAWNSLVLAPWEEEQLWHCAPAATVCCHRPSQLRSSCWRKDFCRRWTGVMTKQTFCFCLVPAQPNYPFYCCLMKHSLASSHKGWQEHTRGDTANVVPLAWTTTHLYSPCSGQGTQQLL